MENTFWVPDETMPHKYNTSTGISKKLEWIQVLGVPCILKKETNMVTLHSFTSSENRTFDITLDYFKEHFKQIDTKSTSGGYIWLEGNGAFRFEEDTIVFMKNGEVEVVLNDLNGRGGMQVKLSDKASYWKYPADVNWNYMSAGTWNIKPIKKIYFSLNLYKILCSLDY